ncbi:MAG: hypothetical protein PHQ12_14490, partial [Chthoniobacteraceae bacterium]|nr:hypothetical protein [Chthoniobacteraceae bacterium]
MLNIFGYLNLAMAVASAVSTVTAEVTAPEPISGQDLANDVAPVLLALQSIQPKLKVPPDAVRECAEAVASVLNARR